MTTTTAISEETQKRNGTICQTERQRVDMVIKDVSDLTGYSRSDILGRARPAELARARFLVYICLTRLGMSYTAAGRWCKRDHGSVINGVKNLKNTREIVNPGPFEESTLYLLRMLKEKGYRV